MIPLSGIIQNPKKHHSVLNPIQGSIQFVMVYYAKCAPDWGCETREPDILVNTTDRPHNSDNVLTSWDASFHAIFPYSVSFGSIENFNCTQILSDHGKNQVLVPHVQKMI